MIAGTVTVDSSGSETYQPNSAANAAKALYMLLLASSGSITVQTKTSGGKATINPDGSITPPPPPVTSLVNHAITPTPQMKQAQAQIANTFAAWLVSYLVSEAAVSVVIPATSAGDGLQTSQTAGSATTHPTTAKTLSGSLS